MSGTEDLRRSDRWTAHPMAARALRLAIRLSPVIAAALVSWQLSIHLRATAAHHHWAVFLGIAAVSLVLAIVVERLARRLMPLTTLLALTMLFPDRAPTRWKVARQATRPLQVEQPDTDLAAQSVTLLALLTSHDRRTRGHSERVRLFADMLGQQLRLTHAEADRLRWAALLHDVGKIEVEAALLNKPGLPTPREWKQLRAHPVTGTRLAGPLLPWLEEWGLGILEHHERYDGTGYPHGWAELEISRAGRLLAVVDAYEVMTAPRSYKRPMSVAKAREELASSAGSHFDPAMVRAFLEISLPRLLWTTGPLAFLANLPFLAGLGTAARTLPALATPTTAAAGVIAAGSVIAAVPATAHVPSRVAATAGAHLVVSQPAASEAGTTTSTEQGSTGSRPRQAGRAPTAEVPTPTVTPTTVHTTATPTGAPVAVPAGKPTVAQVPPGALPPSRLPLPSAPAPVTTQPPTPVRTSTPAPAPTPTPTPTQPESDGRPVTFTLTPTKTSFLQVAVFMFQAPDTTHYSVRLDGGAWTTVQAANGRAGSATVRVGPGAHSFQVVAENGSGKPSEPVATYTWTVI